MSLCLITCGPASTKIDEVRRITNFSTGELGTLLSEALLAAGHEVICFRGEGATFPPPSGVRLESYFGNEELLAAIRRLAASEKVDAIFHAAALTDFEVAAVTDETDSPITAGKISSQIHGLTIRLRPATKVLAQLRGLFPQARIIGWKFEVGGSVGEALEKARAQLTICGTDACILNGPVLGSGFALIAGDSRLDFPDKMTLVKYLARNANPD